VEAADVAQHPRQDLAPARCAQQARVEQDTIAE
jgi:hypothetical protein